MVPPFDTEDAEILSDLIRQAFRAQRMGNDKYRDKVCATIHEWFGEAVYRRLRQTLREDRSYCNNHKTEMVS